MRSLRRIAAFTLVTTCLFLAPVLGQEEGNGETAGDQARRKALQAKVATLPAAKLNTNLQAVSFQTLDLSQTRTTVDGKNYYAFRFRTPDEPGSLVWAFRHQKASWYIVPAHGRMYGFTTFIEKSLSADIKGVGQKGECFVRQKLPAENFKGNSEYIIWFSFEETTTPEMTFSLNMLPGEDPDLIFVFPMIQ